MAEMCSRCWGKNVLPAFLPTRPLASPKYLSSTEVKMSPPLSPHTSVSCQVFSLPPEQEPGAAGQVADWGSQKLT